MKNVTNKSINNIISNIKKIQKNSSKINYWFFRYSLTWIKNRANTLLDQRVNKDNPHPTTLARTWNIKYNENNAILENIDPNSAAIEFGIGIFGEQNLNSKVKNDQRKIAQESGYQYNVISNSKNEKGQWSFYIGDKFIVNYSGYAGKGFLYDSFMEYLQNKKYNEFYQKAFDKVMKSIIK